MTVGNTSVAVLLAAIPVTAMLFIEIGLPYLKKRNERKSGADEKSSPREETPLRDAEGPSVQIGGESANAVPSEQVQRPSRWRQNGRYYQILHQTANSGNLASMDKLGELALVHKDYTEAFYWRLMMELLGAPSPGLSANGICRVWMDAKCPEWHPTEGGLFTEKQARFAATVLDLWSGCHVYTPLETLRQMFKDCEREARLYAQCFGIPESAKS